MYPVPCVPTVTVEERTLASSALIIPPPSVHVGVDEGTLLGCSLTDGVHVGVDEGKLLVGDDVLSEGVMEGKRETVGLKLMDGAGLEEGGAGGML